MKEHSGETGYPRFRRRVLDQIDVGRKVAEVANDMGVSDQTIYTALDGQTTRQATTAAVDTGLQPCYYQVFLCPQDTVWRVLEPI